MDSTTTIFPRAGDTPRGLMSPSPRWPGGIPVLELDSAERYPCLQFDPADYDTAVEFLDDLALVAARLARAIRKAQGDARLLAAVEASPGSAEQVTS